MDRHLSTLLQPYCQVPWSEAGRPDRPVRSILRSRP
ncbi:hypothetical protein CGCA056_v014193 [Colletotrichum aenigma]|nr:uncharacterized protein CGCA056_v014193 [Colletotrichum aenigma]KAF5502588.1 hypothetical protein CGCA056_v014193 [Colletotrichum aenigma]